MSDRRCGAAVSARACRKRFAGVLVGVAWAVGLGAASGDADGGAVLGHPVRQRLLGCPRLGLRDLPSRHLLRRGPLRRRQRPCGSGAPVHQRPALLRRRTGARPRRIGPHSRASRPTSRAARTVPSAPRRRCTSAATSGARAGGTWVAWGNGGDSGSIPGVPGWGSPGHALMGGVRRPGRAVRARVRVRRLRGSASGAPASTCSARASSSTIRPPRMRPRSACPAAGTRNRLRQLLRLGPRIRACAMSICMPTAGAAQPTAAPAGRRATSTPASSRARSRQAARSGLTRRRLLTARTRSMCSPRTQLGRVPGARSRPCWWTTTHPPRRRT